MTKELICLYYLPFLSHYTPVFFIVRTLPFTILSRLFYFTYSPFHNTLPSFLFYIHSLSQYTPVFFILHTLPFTIHSRLFLSFFYCTYRPFHNTLPSFLFYVPSLSQYTPVLPFSLALHKSNTDHAPSDPQARSFGKFRNVI